MHGAIGLRLNEADEGQGDIYSLGDHGIWDLLGRPPKRARAHCANPGHHIAVRVGAAGGDYPQRWRRS
jgi:hypothetical protein